MDLTRAIDLLYVLIPILIGFGLGRVTVTDFRNIHERYEPKERKQQGLTSEEMAE